MTEKRKGAVCAYVRRSTDGQLHSHERQVEAIIEEASRAKPPQAVTRWYRESESGVLKRPVLEGLIEDAARGEIGVLYVYATDRFGRSFFDIVSKVLYLVEECNVTVISCTEPIDTSEPIGKIVLAVLAGFADIERRRILTRTGEGRRIAKARGIRFGRPFAKPTPAQVRAAIDVLHNGPRRWHWPSAIKAMADLGPIRLSNLKQRSTISPRALRRLYDKWFEAGEVTLARPIGKAEKWKQKAWQDKPPTVVDEPDVGWSPLPPEPEPAVPGDAALEAVAEPE